MNDVDRSYIAAFYEAEGCCSVRWGNGKTRQYAQIRISQKDPEILIWMQKTLKIGKLYPPAKDHVVHTLVINRLADVREFARIIYPFMRSSARKEKLKFAHELSRRR